MSWYKFDDKVTGIIKVLGEKRSRSISVFFVCSLLFFSLSSPLLLVLILFRDMSLSITQSLVLFLSLSLYSCRDHWPSIKKKWVALVVTADHEKEKEKEKQEKRMESIIIEWFIFWSFINDSLGSSYVSGEVFVLLILFLFFFASPEQNAFHTSRSNPVVVLLLSLLWYTKLPKSKRITERKRELFDEMDIILSGRTWFINLSLSCGLHESPFFQGMNEPPASTQSHCLCISSCSYCVSLLSEWHLDSRAIYHDLQERMKSERIMFWSLYFNSMKHILYSRIPFPLDEKAIFFDSIEKNRGETHDHCL